MAGSALRISGAGASPRAPPALERRADSPREPRQQDDEFAALAVAEAVSVASVD